MFFFKRSFYFFTIFGKVIYFTTMIFFFNFCVYTVLHCNIYSLIETFFAGTIDLSRCMNSRQQFVQQYSENALVFKVLYFLESNHPCSLLLVLIAIESALLCIDCLTQELENLENVANVYKLIGPVLIRQDLLEARSNVSKRLDFIRSETSV